MKKLVFLIIALMILSIGLYFKSDIKSAADKVFFYSPCDTPIAYNIGTVDDRFKLTNEQVVKNVSIASDIWSNSANKKLFAYDPTSKFTINFVYDSRQALSSKIGQLDTNLQQQENQIKPQMEEYKRRSSQFESDLANLNQQISYWNTHGGAPEDVYKKLTQQQSQLQKEADSLNAMGRTLGQSTTEYNLNADKLNQTINTYQETLQNKPEEGLYIQNGNDKTINIYLNINENELLHTLAHELGHALGLPHVPNPQAIMYPQTSEALAPTSEELSDLYKVCEKKNIFELAIKRYSMLFEYLVQSFQHKTTQASGTQ